MALRQKLRPRNDQTKREVLQAYKRATRPLTKFPKNFDTWLTNWSLAVGRAQAKGYDVSTDSSIWCRDFIDAIEDLKPHWRVKYDVHYEALATTGQLHYGTLVDDFRRELERDAFKKPRQSGVSKGTFGPTYDGMNDDNVDSRKRKHSDPCIVYSIRGHPLERCYYAFSGGASEGWKPRPQF